MKSLREYIDIIKEADAVPAAGSARERARAYRERTANASAPADQQATQPAQATAPGGGIANTTVTPPPGYEYYDDNGINKLRPIQQSGTNQPSVTPQAPAAPVAQPAADPKAQALQKEVQTLQAELAAAQKNGTPPNTIRDISVNLNGAQTDLAKITGAPAPAPVAGSQAAYGNAPAAKRGQEQNINKGKEELRIAQANGDQAAAQAAQAKIDQATANKADIKWADASTPYGTESGKNLTPSTGPVQAPQAANPTPPKPTAPAIPPEQLKKYQATLSAEGYPTTVDGLWGPGTQKAVIDFQRANGLGADGQIGPQTKAALDSFASTPVAANAGKITTTVTPQARPSAPTAPQPQATQPSISNEDKILLGRMLTIAGLR